jgi:hypothetical protein
MRHQGNFISVAKIVVMEEKPAVSARGPLLKIKGRSILKKDFSFGFLHPVI